MVPWEAPRFTVPSLSSKCSRSWNDKTVRDKFDERSTQTNTAELAANMTVSWNQKKKKKSWKVLKWAKVHIWRRSLKSFKTSRIVQNSTEKKKRVNKLLRKNFILYLYWFGLHLLCRKPFVMSQRALTPLPGYCGHLVLSPSKYVDWTLQQNTHFHRRL